MRNSTGTLPAFWRNTTRKLFPIFQWNLITYRNKIPRMNPLNSTGVPSNSNGKIRKNFPVQYEVIIHVYISQGVRAELYWNTTSILTEYNQEPFLYFPVEFDYIQKQNFQDPLNSTGVPSNSNGKIRKKFSSAIRSHSSGITVVFQQDL